MFLEASKVVQPHDANAEESASTSDQMNAQTGQLKMYVGNLIVLVTEKTKHYIMKVTVKFYFETGCNAYQIKY